MRIALFGRVPKHESYPYLQLLLDQLHEKKIEYFIYEKFYQLLKDHLSFHQTPITYKDHQALQKDVDFLLSLGGDGTLLNTLPFVRNSGVPILGVNIGRLGFLTAAGKEEMHTILEQLASHHYFIEKRSALKLEFANNLFEGENYALNDFVIRRKDSASMIIVHVYIDAKFLNSYWADGLIVATPTGSTGYNLACGGPIIHPMSNNFVITPIAPHNLNVRPMVIDQSSKVSIEVENRAPSYLISLDSRAGEMRKQVRFEISKAAFDINLVRLQQDDFMRTLRQKLSWGLDTRN